MQKKKKEIASSAWNLTAKSELCGFHADRQVWLMLLIFHALVENSKTPIVDALLIIDSKT